MTTGQKITLFILGLAALVGLFDSGYLYYEHLTASEINCFLFDGCNTVAASPLSKPFGIPISLIGVLFYLGIFILAIAYKKLKIDLIKNLIFIGGIVAFTLSLYFTYLQGFVIQAWCIYCLISAVTSTIILCTAIYLRENPLAGEASSHVDIPAES